VLIGGERARRAIDAINAELRRNLTDSERGPRSDGPLARAQKNLEHWREAESERSTKLSALEQQFADLTQRRRRRREIADLAEVARMTQALMDAQNSLREAETVQQDIRRLEAEVIVAQRALEGAAQRLRQHREVSSRIDDHRRRETDLTKSLPEHVSREAPTKITVGGLAVVTVTPAVHPWLQTRQKLDNERVTLLKAAGVPSAAEAHTLLAKRRDLENSRRGILAELTALKASDDPAVACAKAKSELAQIEASITAALAATGWAALPSQAEIDAERFEFELRRNALDARCARLDAASKEQRKAVENAVRQLTGTETELKIVRNSIAEDLALCPDADRAARDAAMVSEVADCEAAQQIKATTLAAVRQAAPDAAEIERRQLRCERLKQALENQNVELMQLEGDIGRLTGQIQAAEATASAKSTRKHTSNASWPSASTPAC
jgi:DNA repair exonuclease SbcCD ATPase subunit